MATVENFAAVLIQDVLAAREAVSVADTQVHRRNLVRSSLAAVEGIVWLCREHVRTAAEQIGELTPLADLALQERSYTVTHGGEVVEAVRYIALPASIRLVAKQASRIAPTFVLDLSGAGWQRLLDAIAVRNRITHPKALADLDATDADLAAVAHGTEWMMANGTELLDAIRTASRNHLRDVRELFDALKRGDPDALRLYHAELTRSG